MPTLTPLSPCPLPLCWPPLPDTAQVACNFSSALPKHALTWRLQLPKALQQATIDRQAAFLAGRYCANQALQALGWDDTWVGFEATGLPRWPVGWVGSITHTGCYATAIVASAQRYRALGIDAEQWRSLHPGLARRVMTVEEAHALQRQVALLPGITWPISVGSFSTLLAFSLKESLFKALFPLIRCPLGFRAVRVTEVAGCSCSLVLIRTVGSYKAGTYFRGWFAYDADRVYTTVGLEMTTGGAR